jgi:hypothetical protein
MDRPDLDPLRSCFERRADALFKAMDALLAGASPASHYGRLIPPSRPLPRPNRRVLPARRLPFRSNTS